MWFQFCAFSVEVLLFSYEYLFILFSVFVVSLFSCLFVVIVAVCFICFVFCFSVCIFFGFLLWMYVFIFWDGDIKKMRIKTWVLKNTDKWHDNSKILRLKLFDFSVIHSYICFCFRKETIWYTFSVGLSFPSESLIILLEVPVIKNLNSTGSGS